jgi:hypothetical protein
MKLAPDPHYFCSPKCPTVQEQTNCTRALQIMMRTVVVPLLARYWRPLRLK